MNTAYDKRRMPAAKDASQRSEAPSSMGGLASNVPNSAMASALGYRDAGGDGAGLKSAMEAKAMSVIRPGSFGADYEEPRAEAEASRIGSRFSGASGFEELKSRMGDALGADFSSVRFHTGADAASMAARAGAAAFTSGRDIYMGGGGFDAATAAHEMVHTVQQGAVQASVPTMSTPTGAVQYLRPFSALKDKIVRSHQKAVDQYNENEADFKQMSRLDRMKWAIQNPIAYARGGRDSSKADTAERKRKSEEEDAQAQKLSALWKKGRKEDGEWDEDVFHDAMHEAAAPQQGNAGGGAPQEEAGETQGNVDHFMDQMGKATGDYGADLGLSGVGTPLDIAGVVDAGRQMNKLSKLNETGMKAVGGISGAFGALGDASSMYGNLTDAIESWDKGDKRKAVANGFRAGADALSIFGDVYGAAGLDPLSAGFSGAANTLRAGTDFGSAIQEGVSAHKLKNRGKANQQSIEELERHMGNLSGEDKEKAEKKLAQRKANAKTIKQAGRASGIRRDENIVSGSANTLRAVGSWTSMGLALSGNPAAAIASFVGNGAGALTQFIGNRITKGEKRKLRKDTVNEELGLDFKISALKNGDTAYMKALGITPDQAAKMSDRDAKHLILKSGKAAAQWRPFAREQPASAAPDHCPKKRWTRFPPCWGTFRSTATSPSKWMT